MSIRTKFFMLMMLENYLFDFLIISNYHPKSWSVLKLIINNLLNPIPDILLLNLKFKRLFLLAFMSNQLKDQQETQFSIILINKNLKNFQLNVNIFQLKKGQ